MAPTFQKSDKPYEQSRPYLTRVSLEHLLKMSPEEAADIRVSPSSRFDSLRWDFSDRDVGRPRYDLILRFDRIFKSAHGPEQRGRERLLHSLRCFVYSLLVNPPSPKLGITTFIKSINSGGIFNLIKYMVEHKFYRFSQLDESDFRDFLNVNRYKAPYMKFNTDRTLRSRVVGIEWIYQQSSKLVDSFTFNPWKEYGSASSWAINCSEKVVERDTLTTTAIPDEITRQLVSRAILVINDAEHFFNTLIAYKNHDFRKIDVQKGRCAISGHLLYTKKYANPFPFEEFGFVDAHDIANHYVHLRTAVAILTGLLTGMRPTEILSISADAQGACYERELEINNQKFICSFVRSTLSKNKPSPEVTSWQTVPLVTRAIGSLAHINKYCITHDSPWLFRSLKVKNRNGNNYDGRKLRPSVLSRDFRAFMEKYGIGMGNWDGLISSRSLRRTSARLLTRNGLGLIELQDQLKHFDPDVTRRYGEVSFIDALQKEKLDSSEELYEEIIAGVQPIIGGGAKEIGEYRKYFKGLIRADRITFLKSLPKKALIDQVDVGLCMYRAQYALCGGNKANCKPSDCPNSVIPLDSAISSLQNRKAENEHLLALVGKDRFKRAHLLEQQRILSKLLDQARAKKDI